MREIVRKAFRIPLPGTWLETWAARVLLFGLIAAVYVGLIALAIIAVGAA